MLTWERSTHVRLCGRCGAIIHRGDPVYVIAIQTISTPKVRCVACEGPAPPDLPALPEPVPFVTMPERQPTRFTPSVVTDVLDYKARAAEPGDA